MAEKPNEEADSQSSQLARKEDLQKLVGNGRNNACNSSIAGGEVKINSFVFVEPNPLSLALAQLISEHL